MTQHPDSYFWKRVRLGCFFLGVIISIFAWFIDRAPFYPAVLRVIFPEYAPVKSALTILGEGEKAIVPIDHPGAQILMRWWKPSIPDPLVPDISGICRSTGVFNIITGVHRYELRLCTHNNSMFLENFVWDSNDPKERLQKTLDATTLRWSGLFLVFGLGLSVSTMLWEYRTDG